MNDTQARAILRALCFARVIARADQPRYMQRGPDLVRVQPHRPLPAGGARLDCGHTVALGSLTLGDRVVCEACVQLAEAP